jgi:2-succinyl-5-enolpyruvyl-6-hydroxy-3-cyclohexene-1-carboxylate synthase
VSGSNLHVAWAELLLHAAACAGVRDVVLSPGSRSTPLALAAGKSREVTCHPIVDERSAAFFALGQARVSGRASMLVCTSGTAGAHYFPALIEAGAAYLPLIVVTADRPWELQDAAAPQTIDQRKLFGGHVRHFAELGVPDPSSLSMCAAARIMAQAVTRASFPEPGPVHLNIPFRKPLEPVVVEGPEPWQEAWEALMQRGPTQVFVPRTAPDERAVAEVAERCEQAKRGLIVCGPAPLAAASGRQAIGDLSRATGFPVLAEGTSQMRFGDLGGHTPRCDSFDALLRAPEFRARHAPDLILELGAPPTSAGYAAYLAEHPSCPRYVIAPHGWNDPPSFATALVLADPGELARLVSERLSPRSPSAEHAWRKVFYLGDLLVTTLAEKAIAGEPLCEGSIAQMTVASCPEGSLLAIGNSTPVRDLDTYGPFLGSHLDLRVLHQRGASGIDGLLSGAAGARSLAPGPMLVLLGDLSFLHDLTGLGLLRAGAGKAPCVVVVVDNGGGRIFDQLPLGAASSGDDLFERLFAMPQPLDRRQAAAAFGLPHARATTRAELGAALLEAWARPGPTLVEAVTAPGDGARRAALLWSSVRKGVAELTEAGLHHEALHERHHEGRAP